MATTAKTNATQGDGGPHLFAVKILGKLIDTIKNKLTTKLLDFSVDWANKIGHFGLIAAAAIGFLFFVILTVRANRFTDFLFALVWVIVVFVVQYVAHRFANAGKDLIDNNTTRMSSKAFLDCVAFLAMLGGIVTFVYSIYASINMKSIQLFFIGLGVFVFLEFLALIAFNPETVSMEIVKKTSAGQEAIGIMTFFMKTFLKLVPIAFGIGIAVFTVILFIDMFGLFSDAKIAIAAPSGMQDMISIVIFGLIPFLGYLAFIVLFLGIDITRSILSIPGKLDELKK